ncbi:hypothetical protein Tco_0633668 [Tanacetum coccineum]
MLCHLNPQNEGISHRPYPCPSIEINLPKATDKPRKSLKRPKGVRIKVQSHSSASAGAGSVLKCLRSSKIAGKARICNEVSPVNVNRGKRSNSSTVAVDDPLVKVLDRINYDKGISEQMTFREGVVDSIKKPDIAVKCNSDEKSSGKHMVTDFDSVVNDGSFINDPVRRVDVENVEQNLRTDKVECREDFNMVDNTLSSDNVGTHNVANIKHIDDAHVRNVDKCVNGDGILKKPSVGFSSAHFRPGLFHNHKSSNAWSSNKFGVKNWNADVSLNIESFAERIKKGVEDRELQMSYVPQFVSKQENGARRIDILVEDIKKGAEACYLQLYGYFVGTSMDYRVFKNEERMKAVLESGPWMVNNVPLVLNIWEPGIWLEKVEPSTIPIWVCVHNISMELCNGNGIGKIMSGIGKPMLMEKMTKERCLKKSGKLDFARVPARVAAQATKDSINIKGKGINVTECRVENDDGFVMVGRKNKPAVVQYNSLHARNGNHNTGGVNGAFQRRRVQSNGRQGNGFGIQGNGFGIQKRSNVSSEGNLKTSHNKLKPGNNFVVGSNKSGLNRVNDTSVRKPHLACMYNQDSRPRVLLRIFIKQWPLVVGVVDGGGSGGMRMKMILKKGSAYLVSLTVGISAASKLINDGTYLLLAAEDESTETKFLWYELNT